MESTEMTLYELWGWDTFSSESYLCGTYKSLAEAEAEKACHEEDVKGYQSEGLRDTFSIHPITPSEIKQREARRKERLEFESLDRAYDRERLKHNIGILAEKLVTTCIDNPDSPATHIPSKREVSMTLNDPCDCITALALGFRAKPGRTWLSYRWKISCKTTRCNACDTERGTPHETPTELLDWLSTDEGQKAVAGYIAESLQKEFYKS